MSAGSLDELVALVCAAGPDATVLSPPEAVAAVRAALAAVLSRRTPQDGPAHERRRRG